MKHIKRFNEQSEIVLKNNIGEIVFDYLKIIESGNLDKAKNYLMAWTGGDIKTIWDGSSYVPAIIFTLKRFITPDAKEYQRKRGYDVIEITEKLLDEIKKINEVYFPYKYEITNDEVEKIYEYFYKWVYPQEKIKLMNECVLESIEWTDFLTFYDKEYNPQRFKLVPYLGVVYSGLGTFSGTLQEMQRSILNNEPEYKNYQNKHIIKDSFNTIYQDHFDKTKHGFPFYEYKFDLICQDSIQIDDRLFKKDEIVKLLSADYYIQDKFILTGYIRRIIESWAKHMDMNVKVSVRHCGKSWRGKFSEVAFSFEIVIIDLDFVPPPFE